MATLEENLIKIKKGIIYTIIIIFILLVIKGTLVNVPPGNVGILFNSASGGIQLGEFNNGKEGWGLKFPITQSVKLIDVRTQSIEQVGDQTLSLRDKNGISFKWDAVVRYRIDKEQAAETYKIKGSEKAIAYMVMTALKGTSAGLFGKYPQEELQPEIADKLKSRLQQRIDAEANSTSLLRPGFILIEAIDLGAIRYNDQIAQRIIEEQQRAGDVEKQKYELEAAKQQRDKTIMEAEAAKKAAILKAEGEAQALLQVAEAKTKGIQMVKESYQNMPQSYVQIKYAEALKANAEKGKLIIIDYSRLGGDTLKVLNLNDLIASETIQSAPNP